MDLDSKNNEEELSLDGLETVTGGTGPNDFDMEYWQRYYQECQETAQQSLMKEPNPHSKKCKGRLFR